MSNSIYNILNNFNKVAQEPVTPATTKTETKTKLQESMEQVISEKYMGFKKTVAAVKKGGSAENPEAVAAAIGRKKYGKEKFQKAAAQGKKLGEEAACHDDMEEGNEFTGALAKAKASGAKDFKVGDKTYKVDEVAPPGAKAERMVKHIKKGYAKDGKLTPKEKSIAYATAWKAHKAGKVEEAIAALKTLTDSGMTADQITEGWEDMMKAAKAKSADQGTGKFDKKKTSTGTVYTRKYDPKTGETDDSENVTAVKKGRGRPKKSAFESFVDDYSNSLTEDKSFNQMSGKEQETAAAAAWKNFKRPELDKPNTYDPKAPVLPSDPEGVKEEDENCDELDEMMKLAGMSEAKKAKPDFLDVDGDGDKEESMKKALKDKEKVDECSMMSGDAMGHDEGRMNITTSMDSDGAKNVTITANGNAASELMQMLKLAGLSTSGTETEEAAEEVDEPVEEEKDSRYEASTTPEEEVQPVQALTKGGNGDVAGQEKEMTPNGYKFGDNPMAMKEGINDLGNMGLDLIKEYESIKVQK